MRVTFLLKCMHKLGIMHIHLSKLINLEPNIRRVNGFFLVANLEPITILFSSISSTKVLIYLAWCCPSPSNWIATSYPFSWAYLSPVWTAPNKPKFWIKSIL